MDVTIACICPPKDGAARHEQDTVTLPEVLPFRTVITVRQAIRLADPGNGISLAEMTAVMAEAYLLHSITAWSLEDADGKPLPLSKANIRDVLLTHYDAAEKVGDAADELYSDKVVLPLLDRASSSSLPTPTPGPTSPTNGSGSKPTRKPSKRSSTSTTPMAVTGTTGWSQGGVSSSSPS